MTLISLEIETNAQTSRHPEEMEGADLLDDDCDIVAAVPEDAAPTRRKLNRLRKVCIPAPISLGVRLPCYMPAPDAPSARPLQVTQDKENDSPQQAGSPPKPAAEPDHAASEQRHADGSMRHAGDQLPTNSNPQAEPLAGASPLRPRATPQDEHAGGSVSADDERQTGRTHDTGRSNDDGGEASAGGDVSDAEGSGADMWDEEDEMDDAFRQERMAGLTQENSGHGTEASGEHAHACLLSAANQNAARLLTCAAAGRHVHADLCVCAGSVSGSDEETAEGSRPKSKRKKRDAKELNASTQRMLRGACTLLLCLHVYIDDALIIASKLPGCLTAESAVRDRIGKGHNPDIAPLSGIVAKLKAQQTALAAKCVLLVSAAVDLPSQPAVSRSKAKTHPSGPTCGSVMQIGSTFGEAEGRQPAAGVIAAANGSAGRAAGW